MPPARVLMVLLTISLNYLRIFGQYSLHYPQVLETGGEVCLGEILSLQCEGHDSESEVLRWFLSNNVSDGGLTTSLAAFVTSPAPITPQNIPLLLQVDGIEINLCWANHNESTGTNSYNSTLFINVTSYKNFTQYVSCGTYASQSNWVPLNFSVNGIEPPGVERVTLEYQDFQLLTVTAFWRGGFNQNLLQRDCAYKYLVELSSRTSNYSHAIEAVHSVPFHDCFHNMCSTSFSISAATGGKEFSLAVSAANDHTYYKTPKASFTGAIKPSIQDEVQYDIHAFNCSLMEFSCWSSLPNVNTCSLHYRRKGSLEEFTEYSTPINATVTVPTPHGKSIEYFIYFSSSNGLVSYKLLDIFKSSKYRKLTPREMKIVQVKNPHYFIATWEEASEKILRDYTATVSGYSLQRPFVISTNTPSIHLQRVDIRAQYNLTITTNLCLGFNSNTVHYVIGSCSILDSFSGDIINYTLKADHHHIIGVTCTDGRDWNLDCKQHTTTGEHSATSNVFDLNKCLAVKNENAVKEGSLNSLSVIVLAVACGSMITCAPFTCVLGVICGAKLKKQQQPSLMERANLPEVVEPIYEEPKSAKQTKMDETVINYCYKETCIKPLNKDS